MHQLLDSLAGCLQGPAVYLNDQIGTPTPVERAAAPYFMSRAVVLLTGAVWFVPAACTCFTAVSLVALLALQAYAMTDLLRIAEQIPQARANSAEAARKDKLTEITLNPNGTKRSEVTFFRPIDPEDVATEFNQLMSRDLKAAATNRIWMIDVLGKYATMPLLNKIAETRGIRWSEGKKETYARILHRSITALTAGALAAGTCMATSPLSATAAIVTAVYMTVAAVYEYKREHALTKRNNPLFNDKLCMIDALAQHFIKPYHRMRTHSLRSR